MGWTVSPQKIHRSPEPCSWLCDLIWKQVFTDLIKLRCGHTGVECLTQRLDLYKRRSIWMQTERGRGERYVTMEPKIRAMSRHIKECQGLLATRQGMWRIAGNHEKWGRHRDGSSARSLRGSTALLTPWSHTSCLQNQERINFCCVSCPASGT